MNTKSIAAALALSAALPLGQALAQTKAAVQFENFACIQNPSASPNATGRLSVMTTTLSTSNATSFVVDASLVTGLWTQTGGRSSKEGGQSTATAVGAVEVGVVMDGTFDQNGMWNGYGTVAYPGFVTFDARTQTLTATLGQALTGCTVVAGIVQCSNLSDQAIDLLLDTTSAHSFRFILPNVGVTATNRPHRIDVVAKVSSTTLSTSLGSALASACYGAGSVTVDAVRLGRSFACSSSGCSSQ